MIQLMFTGLWPLIWHFSIGTLLAAGLFAAAWFSPVFKKTLLGAAVAVVFFMAGMAYGVKDANIRNAAKTAAVQGKVNEVIKAVKTPQAKALIDIFDMLNKE